VNLANKITVARIALIPLFVLLLQPYPTWLEPFSPMFKYVHQHGMFAAALIFLLASATDKLDGYIARKYNQITGLGKLLDPLADKLLISAALLMLVQDGRLPSWAAMVIIGREIVITGIRSVASARGIALAADRYGKYKMVLQVAAIAAMLLGNYPFSLVTALPIDRIVMLLAVAMTVYSGFNYIKRNYSTLEAW